MKKTVSNQNVIKGILKEALFLDLEVQIQFKEMTILGRIVEIGENDSRAIMIYLDSFSEADQNIEGEVQLSILFKNFKTLSTQKVSFLRAPFLMVDYPETIELTNERAEQRLSLESTSYEWTRVLLDNGDMKIGAIFKALNISQNGVGGELIFPSSFSLTSNVSLKGDYWINKQWISISGDIRSTRQITLMPDNNYFCIIGIEHKNEKDGVKKFQERARRFDCDFEAEFSPLLSDQKNLRLKIKNVSISGFLAQIDDKKSQDIILSTGRIKRTNSSMSAHIVSYEESYFRFQWVDGEPADQLKWLKEISNYQNSNIDTQNISQDDILSLFCQSGALSEQFIKDQKSLSKNMLKSLSSDSLSDSWLYRWTNRSETGKAKGYVSAMKSGNNCWSIIDLVSDRFEDKVDKNFVPSFFESIMDYALSLPTCPKHFAAWVSGHAFFKSFTHYLENEGASYCLGKSRMLYTRLKNIPYRSKDDLQISSLIEGHEFERIKGLKNIIIENGLGEFSDIFDFDINNFSSNHLKQEFKLKQMPFKREYWEIKSERYHFLSILTFVPEGENPGKWVDSIYLIDLNCGKILNDDWIEVKNEIVKVASAGGFSTHAIRRLSSTKYNYKYDDEIVELTAFVLHPKAWSFFAKP
ncbi:MAG: hypothetical protein K2P81_03300 [Bacteriovoracaceae bacterium]|nr:hypothetical protein [Bacteriovoracaceae bacterium]